MTERRRGRNAVRPGRAAVAELLALGVLLAGGAAFASSRGGGELEPGNLQPGQVHPDKLASGGPPDAFGPRPPVWSAPGRAVLGPDTIVPTLAEALAAVRQGTGDDAALDAYILERMASADVPGFTACVVHGEEVIWSKAYGWANVEASEPMSTDSILLWASVSKPVAATALMQLHDAGLFDLDARADAYLPFAVEHPVASEDITVAQLLSHTAAANDNWDVLLPLVSQGDSPVPMSAFFPGYFVPGGTWYAPASFVVGGAPGDQFVYSNAGFALGAYLAEPLSGLSFPDRCAVALFAPLGMDNTGWLLEDVDVESVAMPYDWDDIGGGGYVPYGHEGWPAYPAGLLRTSPEQLSRLLMVHMGHDGAEGSPILSPLASARMQSVHTPSSADIDYGLGLYRIPLENGGLIGHDGRWWGIRSYMMYRPADDLGVLMATNGHLERLEQFIDFDLILLRLLEEFRQTCPGDANGDEHVDVSDVLAVLAAWGPCDQCAQDIDHDGMVGVTELLATLGGWGACPVVRDTGPFGPVGFGSSQAMDLVALQPAASDVSFTIEAVGDLGDPDEALIIRLSGTTIATVFGEGGSDCPAVPDRAQFTVPAATFNELAAAGAVISVKAGSPVNPEECDGFSFVRVRLEYLPE